MSVLVLWMLGVGALGADWPTYRHDNRRSGVTTDRLTVPLTNVWIHTSPSLPQPAWTGPAKWDAFSGNDGLQSLRNFDPALFVTVADGRVFFGSSTDHAAHALDAVTGKELWTAFGNAPVRFPPTIHAGRAYFGSDDGRVYCVDARTGTPVWEYSPVPGARLLMNNGNPISRWPIRTGVLVQGGVACAAASLLPWKTSYLFAVDAATGTLEGSGCYSVAVEGVTIQGALLATHDTLVAPQGRSRALAYRLADGAALGAVGEAGGVHCLLTDDNVLISGPRHQKERDDVVVLSDAASRGELLTFKGTGRAILCGRHAYFHQDGHVQCLDRIRYMDVQKERNRLAKEKPPDGSAIGKLDEELKGCTLWRVPRPVPLCYAMARAYLLAGADGAVAVLDAKTGEEVWRATVRGRVLGLAVAESRLFASTDRGEILCYK